MPNIFFSYRRQDAAYVTELIRARVTETFGEHSVFMDVDNIPIGADFRKHIAQAVANADLVLAVVGPNWVGRSGADSTERIKSPDDFVRLELETALERGIPVAPILVGNATLPTAQEVPESLRPFLFLQAAQVRPGRDSRSDLGALIQALVHQLSPAPVTAQEVSVGVASQPREKEAPEASLPTLADEGSRRLPVEKGSGLV